MSIWTHIAGIIRIDHLPILGTLTEATVETIIKAGAPRGSEGGLDVKTVKTQVWDKMGGPAVWGYVSFVGDLRDFGEEDVQKIIPGWLNNVLASFNIVKALIRQGIVEVEVETGTTWTFRFDGEELEWQAESMLVEAKK